MASRTLFFPRAIRFATFRASHTEAGLGLRSALPPDTPPSPSPTPTPPRPPSPISDAEWDLRTGRAILVLTQTLPSFFADGLATHSDAGADIYSPNVRLSYTPPPLALPVLKNAMAPTLHIEGFPMYLASSVFVRRALAVLYADLAVALNKVAVQPDARKKSARDKSLFIGLTATGTARVSGAPGQWEVNSTYTFSPHTGLIHVHTVNSIHPAPHHAVYDALRASLGLAPNEPGPGGVSAASAAKNFTRQDRVRPTP